MRALAVGLSLATSQALPGRAAADAMPPGAVRVHHAWESFAASARPAEARKPSPQVEEAYFAWRGAGDAGAGRRDWRALPAGARAAIASALADSATREALHDGAAQFTRRISRLVAPGDTLVLLLLVGGFEEPVLTFDAGSTRLVAAQVECFLPVLGGLGPEDREALAARILWRPPEEVAMGDLFPWCAYAAASVFLPELRERKLGDSASLAEIVLLRGFSVRFAGALYPESRFAGGRPPVTEQALSAVADWRAVGARWFPYGTEPYLAAVFEEEVEGAVPEGATVEETAAILGSSLAREWLDATRVSRTRDEAAEISRLGRFPTLYAWGLLEP
jgi:hypothetical protein